MDVILDIAARHGLRVFEDCAHAIEATHQGVPAGLMGDAGCFSFYPTKNITTGDGGMVITRHRQLFERVKVLSLHGMTADAWTRFVGGPTGYEVIAAGFKYNMTDLAAALGLPQLATIEQRWRRREQIGSRYTERLRDFHCWCRRRPPPGRGMPITVHSTSCVGRVGVDRQAIIAALDAENIGVGIHYVPVHQHPYYRQQFGFVDSDFPNASFVGERTISLPLSPAMSIQDVDDVAPR